MPATRPRDCPAVALAALAAVAAMLSLAVAAGPTQAGAPVPTPPPSPAGWFHEAVHSRDMRCVTAVAVVSATMTQEVVDEHLACSVEMTEPMAGGELSADITLTFAPASAAAGTWTGVFTLARGDGRWSGAGHGAAVRAPGESAPALFGQVDYRGSGDCAGLSYWQLLAGEGALSALSGWIDGPVPANPYRWLDGVATLRVDAITLGTHGR